MAAGDAPREALYARLVDLLGDEQAMTLMRHLPPAEASDLATQQAIGRLEQRMDRLEHRMGGFGNWFHDLHGALREQSNVFHAELRRQTRAFVLGLLGATAAVIASVIGAGLT